MKDKQVRMWVDPEFKKLMKIRAAQEDMKIRDLTKKLAEEMDRKNEKRFKFKIM